ncbi:hypothetical protein ACFLUL_00090 [Chloroflexota bacterium]
MELIFLLEFTIPKGLIHGPLEFKTVARPVMLIDILIAPQYGTVPISWRNGCIGSKIFPSEWGYS